MTATNPRNPPPKRGKHRARPKIEPRLSRTRRPPGSASPTGRSRCAASSAASRSFALKNLGSEPVFSEFRVHNPDSGTLSRGDPRPRRRATTSAPAPTSPSTTWAPASTSSSRWPGWRQARGGKAALARGLPAAVHRGLPRTTAARGEVRFRAGTDCPPTLLAARAGSSSTPTAGWACPGPARRLRALPAAGRRAAATSCAATTTPWRSSPQVRDARAAPARRWPRPFPSGAPDKALAQAAEGAALPLPGRRRAVRRPRRPLPDRRRHGPGQDDPGHRRRRDPRPPLRRRARAGRLPDLAQAPVAAARSSASPSRAALVGRRPARRSAQALYARRVVLQDHQLRRRWHATST